MGIARVRLLEMRPHVAARAARRGIPTATVLGVAVLWAGRALTVPAAVRIDGGGNSTTGPASPVPTRAPPEPGPDRNQWGRPGWGWNGTAWAWSTWTGATARAGPQNESNTTAPPTGGTEEQPTDGHFT